jgi:hypothetical protein
MKRNDPMFCGCFGQIKSMLRASPRAAMLAADMNYRLGSDRGRPNPTQRPRLESMTHLSRLTTVVNLSGGTIVE